MKMGNKEVNVIRLFVVKICKMSAFMFTEDDKYIQIHNS
jgi:hypothetical protein